MTTWRWVGMLLLCACGGEASVGSASGVNPGQSGAAGADASDDASEGSDPDHRALCGEAAGIYCEVVFRCFPVSFRWAFPDLNRCIEQETERIEAILSAPGVTYGPAEWLACQKDRNGLSCKELLLHTNYGTPALPSCALPSGTIANGLPCRFADQCESGHCLLPNALGCGICKATVGLGALCGDGVPCADGLACRGVHASNPDASTENRCVQEANIGESCSDENPCKHDDPCEQGVCPAPEFGKDGVPCISSPWSSECYAGDYYCDWHTGTCVVLDVSAGIGDVCQPMSPGPLCIAPGSCLDGICVAPLPSGSHCQSTTPSPRCAYPTGCIAGVCQMASMEECQ